MPLTVEIANYLWVKTQNESLIGRRHNLISNLLWICVVPGGSIQGRNSSTLPYSFLGTFPLNKTGIVSKTLTLYWLSTNYKKFQENPVGKWMAQDFWGGFSGKFRRATEHLERYSCFSGRKVPNGNFCFIFSKPSSIPVLGLSTNGKRVSGTNLLVLNFAYL